MSNFLVIGGSSGIGLSIVQELANDGHQVFATYNQNSQPGNAQIAYTHLNVLDEAIDLDFLPDTLDGLVYCPGSIALKPFGRFSEEDFLNDFKLQVVGATKTIKAVLPKLKASGDASVVLFSTVAVQQGFNFHSLVSTSKGAIEGLTRALSAELAPTIRINAIAPALTDTTLAGKLLNTEQKRAHHANINPLKKFGTPNNIADSAVFLLSSKASWITGQIMHVDGGMSVVRN